MTLAEFKAAFSLGKLSFYKSKTSSRLVCALPNSGLLCTTEDFNPSKKAYVYGNPKGTDGQDFILSNKEQREADLVL